MSPPTLSLIVRLFGPSPSAVENRREDGATTLENVLEVSYKVNIPLPYGSAIPLLGIYQKNENIGSTKNLHTCS